MARGSLVSIQGFERSDGSRLVLSQGTPAVPRSSWGKNWERLSARERSNSSSKGYRTTFRTTFLVKYLRTIWKHSVWHLKCLLQVRRQPRGGDRSVLSIFFEHVVRVTREGQRSGWEKKKKEKKKKKKIDGKEISSLHWISFSCEKFPIDYLLGLIHKRVLPLNFTFRCTVFHGYLIIIHTCIYIYLYIHT